MEYIFELTHKGSTTILDNSLINSTSIKFKKVDGYVFYKKELSSFVLRGSNANIVIDDYLSNGVDFCSSFELKIYRRCSTGTTTFFGKKYFVIYEGYYNINDCDIDLDKCIVSASLTHENDTDCLLENCDEDFNIFSITGRSTLEYFHTPYVGSPVTSRVEDNMLRMIDVMEYLANETCPQITCVVSNFFQWNPTVTTSINYVTGVASEIGELLITDFTDLRTFNDPTVSRVLNMSLCDLLEHLRCMFNVHPVIEGDCLRIEHKSYFSSNQTLDLFNSTDDKLQKYIKGNNKFSFNDDELFYEEEFTYESELFTGFDGRLFYLDANGNTLNCLRGEKNNKKIDDLYVDLRIFEGSLPTTASSDKAYVIVNAEPHFNTGIADYRSLYALNYPTGTNLDNGHLSFYNLITNYHLDDRTTLRALLLTGGVFHTEDFNSVKKVRVSEPITIPFCCENHSLFTPESQVKLQFDEWGEIAEFEYFLDTKKAKLNYTF